jgi:hypothetical protein
VIHGVAACATAIRFAGILGDVVASFDGLRREL